MGQKFTVRCATLEAEWGAPTKIEYALHRDGTPVMTMIQQFGSDSSSTFTTLDINPIDQPDLPPRCFNWDVVAAKMILAVYDKFTDDHEFITDIFHEIDEIEIEF